jgi:predicted ArsR family transcriptional regulator
MHKQSSGERILYLLKTRGPQTAALLAGELGMTSMGARQHLQKLERQQLVGRFERAEQVGRPRQYWQLSAAGQARFPDRHADLSLSLIENVRELFGEEGLDSLITRREQQTERDYLQALDDCTELGEKLVRLAELRSAEGYMAVARYDESEQCWLLLENHCPICAAAQSCQGFCRAELELFRRVLNAEVERSEHIVLGARRCCYRIRPGHSFCESKDLPVQHVFASSPLPTD